MNIRELDKKEVLRLQRLLRDAGYVEIDIDGIVGPQTIGIFNKFKEDNYLEYPMLIGETTWGILEERAKSSKSSNSRKVNKKAIELMHNFEGLSLVPYRCPAGVPTIG